MIYIFHGDDQFASRTALNQFLDQKKDCDILRADNKNINPDLVNNFLNSPSLFTSQKILVINNFFSIPKAFSDKFINLLKEEKQSDIVLWQDKTITPTQIKVFPKAKLNHFQVNKILFTCLNQIRPKNLAKFIGLYQKVLSQEPFELFLFFVKNNFRKQLTSYSPFDKKILQKAYLQLIELDYQSKTGQLAIPKEIALQRIITQLIK